MKLLIGLLLNIVSFCLFRHKKRRLKLNNYLCKERFGLSKLFSIKTNKWFNSSVTE